MGTGLVIDLDAVPVLTVRLDGLSDGFRCRVHHLLPRVPRAGAGDPDMPADSRPRRLWASAIYTHSSFIAATCLPTLAAMLI